MVTFCDNNLQREVCLPLETDIQSAHAMLKDVRTAENSGELHIHINTNYIAVDCIRSQTYS